MECQMTHACVPIVRRPVLLGARHMYPQLWPDCNIDHIFERPCTVMYLSPTTDMAELSWCSGCECCEVNPIFCLVCALVESSYSNAQPRNPPLPLHPLCQSVNIPLSRRIPMHPANRYSEAIINKEGNKVGEGSTQPDSEELRWTYSVGDCAVYHEDSCKDCDALRKHYNADDPESLEDARSRFYEARDNVLGSTREDLEQETRDARQEIDALNHELRAVEAEIERVRQDQQTIQVVRTIQDTLGQLQHASEIEGAGGGASLSEPICISSGSDGEQVPSSYRPRKRLRQTHRPTIR